MEKERNWNEIAKDLNYAVKNYQGITKMIVQIKNRAHAYGIDPEHDEIISGRNGSKGKTQGLESIKDTASRQIKKALIDFPIWSEWLENVPGIGPAIAGQLVSLYYFKSIPICPKCEVDLRDFKCPKCETEAKGGGVLKFRTELREFPTISSWWHFMGRHNDPISGKMPKRRKMTENDEENPNNWRSDGRTLGFQIREQFNRLPESHKYKAYAQTRKAYRMNTHPDATKGHRHNMAWNETVKLFLSHFWQVAHILDGYAPEEITKPWCEQHGGHDPSGIIAPYYFGEN